MIRPAALDDAAAIYVIYNYYIEHTVVTFEEELLPEEEMCSRIAEITKNYPWLVYEEYGKVLGYAYANQWHKRYSYRKSVESTIYLAHDATGKGIGTQLYTALLDEIKKMDFHCVIGGISLPNEASVAIHEKMGFIKAAHYKEVGWKFNSWIDVGYWQLML
jgi:phosphinothricin acetyltransferase